MQRRNFLGVITAILASSPLATLAETVEKKGQIIELQIHSHGTRIADKTIKMRVREGQTSVLTYSKPELPNQFRYTVNAQRAVVETLPEAAKKIISPINVNIRVDSSTDGQTWVVENEGNMIIAAGSSASLSVSNNGQSKNLTVSTRLVSEEEHRNRRIDEKDTTQSPVASSLIAVDGV